MAPASGVDEPVVCRLVTVPLTDDVECLGLSSPHGDPTQSESILVNGQLIARGEVVVVDEDYAIRVTEIVTPGTEAGA